MTARANSIRRTVNIAGAGHPGDEVKLVLPVDPETFFIEDASNEAESIGVRMPETRAG